MPHPLRPNRAAIATAEISIPENAAGGSYPVTAILDTRAGISERTFTANVNRIPGERDEVEVTGGALTSEPPGGEWGVGDELGFTYRVENLSSNTVTVVPSGNLRNLDPADGAPNCRWLNLPGNDGYNCASANHIVTEADIERGHFTPETLWEIQGSDGTYTIEHTGQRVELP